MYLPSHVFVCLFSVNCVGVGPSGQNDCTGDSSQEQRSEELEVKVSVVSRPSSECGHSELASVPAAEHYMVKSASGEKSSTAKPTVVSVGTQADLVLDECDQQNELRMSPCPSSSAAGIVAAGNEKKRGCAEMSVGSSLPLELESTQELTVPQVKVEIESCSPPFEWENKRAKDEPSNKEKPNVSSVSINAPTAASCESDEYSCRWCEKKLRTFTAITRHERVHTGEKPFVCSYCKKSFSLLANKLRHERLHTGEKPYCCNYCEKRYADSSGLRFHVKTHLKERKKELTH